MKKIILYLELNLDGTFKVTKHMGYSCIGTDWEYIRQAFYALDIITDNNYASLYDIVISAAQLQLLLNEGFEIILVKST